MRQKSAEVHRRALLREPLSGVKEDEYLRDGITEDIITELSKIEGLNIFSRPTVLAYRDKPVTPAQIGQQLERGVRPRREPAPRRQPAAHQRAARRHADRLPALVRALRPRDEGRLRSPGRDRAQDRRGAAHHALAAGAGGARRQADREPAGLRPLPSRQELRPPPDAPGPRVRAADVRERRRAGSEVRARVRRDRERLRADALQLRARPRLDRARARRVRQGRRPAARLPEVLVAHAWMPLRQRSVRRGRVAVRAGHRAEDAIAKARTTCSAARSSRRAGTRRWRTWPRRPWRRAARTTTSTSPS